ncbi:MAG: arginine--tRNA ligase [Pirellula sp.]|jgi:arginyl-tRNA synthetase
MQLLNLIRSRFTPVLSQWVTDPVALQTTLDRIVASREVALADYQANVAMPLQKVVGKPPMEIAQTILNEVKIDDLCSEVSIAGAGYVNLRLSNAYLAKQLDMAFQSENLGVEGAANPKTYVIDFSSPNVAKPMHVGHIRSTVIGDAISKVLKFLGHTVITDNHLGDWGTQFGMIIYGYKYFRNEEAFAKAQVAELGRLYRVVQRIIGYQSTVSGLAEQEKKLILAEQKVALLEAKQSEAASDKKIAKELKSAQNAVKEQSQAILKSKETIAAVESDTAFKKLCDEHCNLESRVLKETSKLHHGDKENLALWESFLPFCKEEIHGIYKRLNVQFDHEYGESFYHEMLPAVVEDLLSRSLAEPSEGAICVFLEGYEAPMIVQKQDGAFLYSTTDIATAMFREREFGPDASLYVVDHRQSEHFQKLFAVLEKIGLTHTHFKHVSFGTVMGNDGKPFKTRAGDNIGLESMLDEAIARAWEVVCDPERLKKARQELSEEDKREIANIVGIGAIKYADLCHNRTSDYVFDMDKMVALDGNTAAYIQYSYARTRSILQRAVGEGYVNADWGQQPILIDHVAERTLALQILRFEDTLAASMTEYLPNGVTEYLFDLARCFSSFFDQCSVLNAESLEQKQSRLKLTVLAGRILKQGLELLGIETVERM